MKLFTCFSFILLLQSYVVRCQFTVNQIIDVVGEAQRNVLRRELTPTPTQVRAARTGLDRINRQNDPETNRELSIGGRVIELATLKLRRRNPVASMSIDASLLTPLNASFPAAGFSQFMTMAFRKAAAKTCVDGRPVKVCDHRQRYRETDGQCNNLVFKSFPSGAFKLGASFTAQGRFMFPEYDDGISSPRVRSVTSGFLPNARFISKKVHSGKAFVSDIHTPFLTHFGQYLDHDVVSTPEIQPKFMLQDSHCCLEPNIEGCFNINFEPDAQLQGSCMRFNRADTSPSYFCNPGPRLQQNQRSSFIDSTIIYGWDAKQEAKLREPGTGRLITGGDEQLKLEKVKDPFNPSCIPVRNKCFEAGDHRSLETVPMTVMYVSLLRRHNLFVEELRKLPLPWTPELLYQEAKRIVIAEVQHIVYNEFLPRVLGRKAMREYRLWSAPLYSDTYSPFVDPRTTSGFSAAAFRFGHSLVRNVHDQIGPGGSPVKRLYLKNHFDRLETHLKKFPGGNTEGFARWMKLSPNSRADGTFVDGLQNSLFPCQVPHCPMGGDVTRSFDLPALNIQRGRDHGLPSYTKWRYWCSGKRTMIFTPNSIGLSDHSPFEANILRKTYKHVEDIDLYTGAMTETRLPGALVGPTFACIIGKQFSNFKRGDRFFYERPDPVMAFTAGQLAAIKETSLAKVFCSTMRSFDDIQINLMDIPGVKNPIVKCNELLRRDILAKIPTFWKKLPFPAFRSAAAKAAKYSRKSLPYIPGRSWNPRWMPFERRKF